MRSFVLDGDLRRGLEGLCGGVIGGVRARFDSGACLRGDLDLGGLNRSIAPGSLTVELDVPGRLLLGGCNTGARRGFG